jgi:hypothetical protein
MRKRALMTKLAGVKCRVSGKCGAKRVGVAAKLAAKFRAKRGQGEPTCGGGDDSGGDGACSAGGVCGVILLCLMLGAGCAMQPSRSQTMSLEGNTINVYVSPRLPAFAVVDPTNAVPSGVAGGDTLCQAMMIETGGNESNPQTASADTALNLPMGDTAVSALGELIGSSISGVLKTTGKGEDGATGADGP